MGELRVRGVLGGTLSTAVAVVGLASAWSSSAGAAVAQAAGPEPVSQAAAPAPALSLTGGTGSAMTFSTAGRPSHVTVLQPSASLRVRAVAQAGARDARVRVRSCALPWAADGTCPGRTAQLAATGVQWLQGGLVVGVSGGANLQVASSGDVAWVLSAA